MSRPCRKGGISLGEAVAPEGDEPIPSRSPSPLDALACYGAIGAATQKNSHTNVWLRAFMFASIGGRARFDWDPGKDHENQRKHGVAFAKAQFAFADPRRIIAEDRSHSSGKKRSYCFGVVEGGILTGRFTYRGTVIRIYGVGY